MHHHAVGDEADVGTLPLNFSLPDRNCVITVRDLLAVEAVGLLVLEDDNRVGVTDGSLKKAFGIVRCGNANDLESGDVSVEGLDALRVVGAAVNARAVGGADGDGT